MEILIFQLRAPLSSWGEAAVGEYRPSAEYPSQSALHGLLGAALGIERQDAAAQAALRDGVRLAVGVLSQGRLLRDFHTAQVPGRADLKKRPKATRRDELALPKFDLNTIPSTRDYRQDAAALVAVQALTDGAHPLAQLADALKRPVFVPYLGRKSCPLAHPMHPSVLSADTVMAGFTAYQAQLRALWESKGLLEECQRLLFRDVLNKIVWGDDFGGADGALIGATCELSTVRKDQVITRQGWQFADRREHISLLVKD